SSWGRVQVRPLRKDHLAAQVGPPVRVMEEIRPARVVQTPSGQTVVDMGQNMVGWVRIRAKGPAGTRIRLRHAEALDSQGELYTANLRSAQQVDEYVLAGTGEELLEPHFTFHGFRYVGVEGWPGSLALEQWTGVVIYSGFARTGQFTCSDPLINRLQENIWWGQRGNFVDIPSDCPQRDERLGWTGDAQVFARTACFNAQVAGFYTKWLADLKAEQHPDGAVPHVVPDTYTQSGSLGRAGAAGWADAAVIVPWTLYLCYGDVRILEEQYESMKAWVDYLAARAGPDCLDRSTGGFGDWLAFHSQGADYPGATTDQDLVSQAYFARSTDLLHRTAKVLGKAKDSARYADLLARIKRAFHDEFVTPGARLTSSTQTAYALALAFDLLPQDERPAAALRLAEDVRRRGHITAGFLGTPWVCHALSSYGYTAEAYGLLERKEYPSWLYPITRGATTIWERWDGIRPDGSFQDPTMNSFNHYAYGAIGDWLYRVVAGIEIDEDRPGYRHILLQPHLGGSLTHAQARLDSLYGRIVSSWTRQDRDRTVEVQVPANTTATVRLPHAWIGQVTESGRPLDQADGVSSASQVRDGVAVEIGSGQYAFQYREAGDVDVHAQPGYVRGSFIYPLENRPTPQCHASTIVETRSGLVAAWFAGTHERHPDVGIRVSRSDGRMWSASVEVANGLQPSGERHPCWNPVLFQPRSGPLMLFYKVGPSPGTWWGMVTTSEDDGRTWSPPRRLGDGPLGPLCGPVKNKPVQLPDGAILCPSSTESDGWRVHFEVTRDLGRTWQVVGPVHDGVEFAAIQPTLLVHPGGRLQALCRSRQDVVTQVWSEDNGRTWGPMTATSLPNPSSGIDGVTLADGRHLLVYNHTVRNQPFPAARQMLNVALSVDGRQWKPILILECAEGQYSYPAVIQTSDGLVHATYTYNRETVKHVVLDPSKIEAVSATE
ncbi:MAG: family 78 glycoside hydrolase catalytic domain, partial [Phycisphaerae bacterium]|nr:family 78 glycoside hydrolase catalytic domain [Phycisphaerae bacterium]